MPFQCGIIGLPNAGKSTLFSALTSQEVETAAYPFTTIDPNKGIVPVLDERLQKTAQVAGCKKATPASLTFVDIAGLVKGASKGEGLGNQFLAHIREMDLLLHLVRGFTGEHVTKTSGKETPIQQAEIVELELAMADLATLEKRKEKLERQLKAKDKMVLKEYSLLEKAIGYLSEGKLIKETSLAEEDNTIVEGWQLLTAKSLLYALNINEETLCEADKDEEIKKFRKWARSKGAFCLVLSAALETELSRLEGEEKRAFLEEYGLQETALKSLTREGKNLLQLINFFTVKGEEARAWAVTAGTRAKDAAGKVHSDMAKGFILADVIFWEELVVAGSFATAKEQGLVRQEGKDYQVKDGEVLYIRFRA